MSNVNKVKWAIRRIALIAIVVLLGSGLTFGQDRRNFWLLNNTGQTISSFYVSPHESNHWGVDVLGAEDLPNGIGAVISFSPGIRTSCVMDFKIVFNDGIEQSYRQGRNVCSLGAVQFNRRDAIGLILPE
jgi:hypothetical protein